MTTERHRNSLSTAEAKALGKKGGLASGAARREKRNFRLRIEQCLLAPDAASGLDNADAIAAALVTKALTGDIKAFEVIRDTIGEKPRDKVDNNISGELEVTWKS